MELDQDTRREILVGTGSVALFIALLVGVGSMYGIDGQDLTETGALAVVGVIIVFVLVMTLVGYWMSRQY